MTSLRLTPADQARALIDDAIAKNGAMRVLIAAAFAVLRDRRLRRARPPDAHTLPDRLRADIGLNPRVETNDYTRYLR